MSKDNNDFKSVIKSYLEKRAQTDTLFAASYAKKNKNIDECCNFILGEAKKLGNAVCMSDDEVYGLAVHYYDEDNLKVNKVHNARVSTSVPSAKVELTEEEKAAAKERALKVYEAAEQKKLEEKEKARKEALKKKAAQQHEVQPSLFDF